MFREMFDAQYTRDGPCGGPGQGGAETFFSFPWVLHCEILVKCCQNTKKAERGEGLRQANPQIPGSLELEDLLGFAQILVVSRDV